MRWGEDNLADLENAKEHNFLLIDLPDYEAGGGGRMRRHLDAIGKFWYESRYGYRYKLLKMVVAVQKELFRDHYILGKGLVFELRPLTPEELVDFYFRKFDYSIAPFDGDSLELVGRMSWGIFRRFMRYVRLCVQDMLERGAETVGVDDVRKIITRDVLGRDMDLELSGFIRGSERSLAVAAICALMADGEMNQKDLAARLGVTQGMAKRLLVKLENWGTSRGRMGQGRNSGSPSRTRPIYRLPNPVKLRLKLLALSRARGSLHRKRMKKRV